MQGLSQLNINIRKPRIIKGKFGGRTEALTYLGEVLFSIKQISANRFEPQLAERYRARMDVFLPRAMQHEELANAINDFEQSVNQRTNCASILNPERKNLSLREIAAERVSKGDRSFKEIVIGLESFVHLFKTAIEHTDLDPQSLKVNEFLHALLPAKAHGARMQQRLAKMAEQLKVRLQVHSFS